MKLSRWSEEHATSQAAGLAVLVACVLDSIGEPPMAWHPVVWYGKLIKALERCAPRGRVAQFCYGIAMLVVANSGVLICTLLLDKLVRRAAHVTGQRLGNRYALVLYAYSQGIMLKPFFALRMLANAGRQVRLPLAQNDIELARQALRSLVSRDRSQLSAELIAAAAVESLAENLSDSIVAPLFFYLLFGLPGAATYRLCNTFDSMIGYHGNYEYLGKPAAHLDDVLNRLPALLTALLISICAPLYGGDPRRALRTWLRDARKTASPNAGQPMSAAAGALGIQLEKVDHYILGDSEKSITPDDIGRAERMVWYVGGISIALTMLCKICWKGWYGK
ncbi:MAG: adenosylcobinamide-phosphate synthase CbiB [Ktedonobacteraceae bacterium]